MKIFPVVDVDGRLYHPVVQASALAKYSRSPDSMTEIMERETGKKADKFHEKVLVQWGHSSCAELASIPVAFEDVSIILSKKLESLERPGCSEKSTRMQEFSEESVYLPQELQHDPEIKTIVPRLFDLYRLLLAELPAKLEQSGGPEAGSLPNQRQVFDIARYCLPAGTRTNLALNAYPRDLSFMISDLRASSLDEFQEAGNALKEALNDVGGPLIRHTDANEWLQRFQNPTHPMFRNCAAGLRQVSMQTSPPFKAGVTTCLVENSLLPCLEQLVASMYETDWTMFRSMMNGRPFKTEVPDLFKMFRIGFNIMQDYGAFRDLQRHRRLAQFPTVLSTSYGFEDPPGLANISRNHLNMYRGEMHNVDRILSMSEIPVTSKQYAIPLGFRYLYTFIMDLKELYYLVELRTQLAGHISYRQASYDMYKEACRHFKPLMGWCRVNTEGLI